MGLGLHVGGPTTQFLSYSDFRGQAWRVNEAARIQNSGFDEADMMVGGLVHGNLRAHSPSATPQEIRPY